jgi:hypothetical protein
MASTTQTTTMEYEDTIKIAAEIMTLAIMIGVPALVIVLTVAAIKKVNGHFGKVDQLQASVADLRNTLFMHHIRMDMIQAHAEELRNRVHELEANREDKDEPVPGVRATVAHRGPVNVPGPVQGVRVDNPYDLRLCKFLFKNCTAKECEEVVRWVLLLLIALMGLVWYRWRWSKCSSMVEIAAGMHEF